MGLKVDVITGALYGDEGKGKVVSARGRGYDAILRVNASTNATHCVTDGVCAHVTRQMPSLFFGDRTELVLAPGALLNLPALADEVASRGDVAGLPGRVRIATTCALVLPPYIEKGQGGMSVALGSTHQGTGPSVVARAGRHTLRVYDILAAREGGEARREVLARLRRTSAETLPQVYGALDASAPVFAGWLDAQIEATRRLDALLGPTWPTPYTEWLRALQRRDGARALIEGCNGMLLDNLHGGLPHVTSTPTGPAAMLAFAHLSPAHVERLIVVMAAYGTCLGKRPFVAEMTADEARHFYERCDEVDPTQHQLRRLGWLDLPALRKALTGAEGATLHMNKLDVLSGAGPIKLCVAYLVDGVRREVMPDDPRAVARATPVWEVLPGWDDTLREVRAWSDLPANARAYVARVEEALELPIASVGVGPRDQDVVVR